jgi:flagellar basal-body rod protein FlgB
MNVQIGTRLSEQIGSYLDLATAEIKLTAANMANIDTPGYRTVGLDFEAEMRGALNDGDLDSVGPGDVGRGHAPRQVRVRNVDGLISRPDGNNVSMDREGLNLAEAQLKFKVGVALLREENQTVMDAIHADK